MCIIIYEVIAISTVLSILIALVVFGILIFVHELGHFLTAKAVGMRVEEFSIGMGPAIFKKKNGETTYAVRALPVGGYVQLEGEDGADLSPRSFSNKPAWARFLVLFAGAFMNILIGIIVSIGITAADPVMPSTTIDSFDKAAVSTEYLQAGDKLLAIDGQSVHIARDVDLILTYTGGVPVTVKVERDGVVQEIENVIFLTEEQDGIKFSMRDFYFTRGEKTFFSVIRYGFFQAASVTRSVWSSLAGLITGEIPISALSGPVGTTEAMGQAAKAGFASLMYFMMFISINLGIVNLLPFPALDGGRILMLLIEKIIRRKIPEKVEAYINLAGFALLMALMVFITFSDILKFF